MPRDPAAVHEHRDVAHAVACAKLHNVVAYLRRWRTRTRGADSAQATTMAILSSARSTGEFRAAAINFLCRSKCPRRRQSKKPPSIHRSRFAAGCTRPGHGGAMACHHCKFAHVEPGYPPAVGTGCNAAAHFSGQLSIDRSCLSTSCQKTSVRSHSMEAPRKNNSHMERAARATRIPPA